MANPSDIQGGLLLIQELLRDISERMIQPSNADRRAAALKLERIVAIASTLAATVHGRR